VETWRWTRATKGANARLKVKGQGHWERKRRNRFFEHILVKVDRFFVKPRPKWSVVHSTHIVEYISSAEMLRVSAMPDNDQHLEMPTTESTNRKYSTIALIWFLDVGLHTTVYICAKRYARSIYCVHTFGSNVGPLAFSSPENTFIAIAMSSVPCSKLSYYHIRFMVPSYMAAVNRKHSLQHTGFTYTVSQKMHQLWNGIARNCKDQFWWNLAEIFKRL